MASHSRFQRGYSQPSAQTGSVSGKCAKDFLIDGSCIPGVPFAVPDSYAGLLSAAEDESKQMFFWYHPSESDVGQDDIVMWIQGGNVCSGLQGALGYLGPWVLPFDSDGTPVVNEYSWTKLANVVFLDYPIPTGFSTGPAASGSNASAHDFYVFLNNFFVVFPELAGKRLWLASEVSGGKYIDYILEELFLTQIAEVSISTTINYAGFLYFTPLTGDYTYLQQIPAPDFAFKYQMTLGLNASFIANLYEETVERNVTNIIQDNLLYPSPPSFPLSTEQYNEYQDFAPYDDVYDAMNASNECLGFYNVYDTVCHTDPLGFAPNSRIPSTDNWINNNEAFKAAIHVDVSTQWQACSLIFGKDGDSDPRPDDTFLGGQVFTLGTHSSMIVTSEWSYPALADGIALNLQFIEWGSEEDTAMGFFSPPTTPFMVRGQQAGGYTSERGLTLLRVDLPNVGVQVALDSPPTGFAILQFLLGQMDN